MKAPSIYSFIRKHRKELSDIILQRCPGIRLNDQDRRLWILNDEGLYLWAKSEGVEI